MSQLQNLKYYLLAFFTETILVQAHFWEGLDEWMKRGTMAAGIVIAVLTAIKLYQDITSRTIDNKLKQLDLRKKDEEVRRMFEEKYRTK